MKGRESVRESVRERQRERVCWTDIALTGLAYAPPTHTHTHRYRPHRTCLCPTHTHTHTPISPSQDLLMLTVTGFARSKFLSVRAVSMRCFSSNKSNKVIGVPLCATSED